MRCLVRVRRRLRSLACYALPVRYVVLLRYGLRDLRPVLKIDRSQEGHIRCWETVEPFMGMAWSMDGRFEWTSDAGGEHHSHREPPPAVREPRVAYSVPGAKLLDARVPAYASDIDQGATVQISAHAVLEEPQHVALQLILVPRGEEPYHRETVGDRRIDDGDPDLWVVLDRRGDDPPGRPAAVHRVLRWPPPLRAQAKP
jgi:hypothetical protein